MNPASALILSYLLTVICLHAETTGLSLISFSVQIQPGTAHDAGTGLESNLSISSTGEASGPNGELRLADNNVPYTHQSFFVYDDPTSFEPVVFPFVLDVPDAGDADQNGVPDFFDRGVETPGVQTSGRHPTADGKGADFTAKWTRAAGESSGTVLLSLPYFGLTSTHSYSILQYDGQFTYSRSNQALPGTVLLTNVAAPDDQLSGPLSLTITNNDQLGSNSETWSVTGGAKETFNALDSLNRTGTNYITLLAFDDGYPATSDADYLFWFLVLHSADANTNGVLDLVESTSARPELDIGKSATGIEITIHGIAGTNYTLEGTDSLSNPAWSTLQSISLTAATQTVQRPSTGPAKFFRLRQ